MLAAIRIAFLALYFPVVCVLGLLICLLRPFNRNNSRIIAMIFAWARFVMNVRVDVLNRPTESIQGIYVANHQSTLDMYMYGESLPDDMAILGKHSLMYIPLFGVLFWLAGNIFINRFFVWIAFKKGYLVISIVLCGCDFIHTSKGFFEALL